MEYQLSLPLPETFSRPTVGWLRALVTSPTIITGTSYIYNPICCILTPHNRQTVIISPTSVMVYGSAHSYSTCQGNPVVTYIQHHGKAQGSLTELPNNGYTLTNTEGSIIFNSPLTNKPYSNISGNFNPIHISLTVQLCQALLCMVCGSALPLITMLKMYANGEPSHHGHYPHTYEQQPSQLPPP